MLACAGGGPHLGEHTERVHALERAVRNHMDAHNKAPKPFTWVKSTDEILASIARFAKDTIATHPSGLLKRTTETGH